jgi:hypothetical protein
MIRPHHFMASILLLAAVLVIAPTRQSDAKTQLSYDPIILIIDGNLWSWTAPDLPLVKFTDWKMNRLPSISPDGTKVAYVSAAQVFVDWLKTVNGAGGFIPPWNIWILDISTGRTFCIADQQPDAVYTGPDDDDLGRYTLRTTPSWSPDGRQIAWMELQLDTISAESDQNIGMAQLVVYDFASATRTVLDSFVVSKATAHIELYDVQWGRPGIALKVRIQGNPDTKELQLYNPSGRIKTQFTFDQDDTTKWAYSKWIMDQDQDYLCDISLWADTWLNWQTQTIEPMTGVPEMVSLSAPDGAHFFAENETWHLVFPGENAIDLGDQIRPLGISRDGQRVVYGRWELNDNAGMHQYTLVVQSKAETFEIGKYQNIELVWGPVGWQVSR